MTDSTKPPLWAYNPSAAKYTRAGRLRELTEKYPTVDAVEDFGNPDARYLLVEQSTEHATTEENWLTLHASIEEACAYWSGQENPEYWEPWQLVDLETGDVYSPTVTFSVTFTKDASEAQHLVGFSHG